MTTLSTLHTTLATKLRDATNVVWGTTELDEILTEVAQNLWPRVAQPVSEDVTLVADTDTYTLTKVWEISRIDMLDSNGALLWPLSPGSWEFRGDFESAGGELFVNRFLSLNGTTLRVHGYRAWDITDAVNTLPARYQQYLIARAAAEAVRRMFTDRAKFKQWMAVAQEQNISPIEFSVMLNSMDNEALRLERQLYTWRKPKPATV